MSVEWITAHWGLSPSDSDVQTHQGIRCAVDPLSGHIEEVLEMGASAFDEIKLPKGTTLLTPGLVNAHTHLELYRHEPIPIEAGQTFVDWLFAVIDYKKGISTVDQISACHHSLVELIRTGTTCVNDISSDGAALVALDQIGMRGIVSPEVFILGALKDGPNVAEQVTHAVTRWQDIEASWQDHPLIQLGLSPHSPYNVSTCAWKALLEKTQPALVHTHLCETQTELDYFNGNTAEFDRLDQAVLGQTFEPSKTGVSPVQVVESVLNAKTVAAHGVYLTSADIQMLAQKGVKLVHCPQSNQWISGPDVKMPYHDLKSAGVPVALGTDSMLSTPEFDMRADARLALALHGLSAAEAFRLATVDGAQVLGLEKRIGQIKTAFEADLVLWWNPDVEPGAVDNPAQLWLDPRTEAVMVWVNGRVILDRCASCWSD